MWVSVSKCGGTLTCGRWRAASLSDTFPQKFYKISTKHPPDSGSHGTAWGWTNVIHIEDKKRVRKVLSHSFDSNLASNGSISEVRLLLFLQPLVIGFSGGVIFTVLPFKFYDQFFKLQKKCHHSWSRWAQVLFKSIFWAQLFSPLFSICIAKWITVMNTKEIVMLVIFIVLFFLSINLQDVKLCINHTEPKKFNQYNVKAKICFQIIITDWARTLWSI